MGKALSEKQSKSLLEEKRFPIVHELQVILTWSCPNLKSLNFSTT